MQGDDELSDKIERDVDDSVGRGEGVPEYAVTLTPGGHFVNADSGEVIDVGSDEWMAVVPRFLRRIRDQVSQRANSGHFATLKQAEAALNACKRLDKAIEDLNDLLDAPRLNEIGVQLAMPLA